MPAYIVATVDEIPPGGRKIVEVAGRSLGIFNVGGTYYALRNRCPHQGGPLCDGVLTGFLEAAEPGVYHYTRKGEILRCPWHGWEFDVTTGQSWFDPSGMRVRRYPVLVESGTALGETDVPKGVVRDTRSATEPHVPPWPPATIPASPQAQESGGGGLQPGPYVAETYPVSVDQSYLLVTLDG